MNALGRTGFASAIVAITIVTGGIGASAAPGDLDPAFGTGGIASTPVGLATDSTVDSEGRVIVVGVTSNGTNSSKDLIAARFTSSGVLDTTFDGDGVVVIAGLVTASSAAVGVDALDRVYIGTDAAESTGSRQLAVMRLTAVGAIDVTYGGGDGLATVDNPDATSETPRDLAVAPTGVALACGQGTSTINYSFVPILARLDASGAPDTTFSTDGLVAGPANGFAYSCAVAGDGSILVGGGNGSNGQVHRYSSVGASSSVTTVTGLSSVWGIAFLGTTEVFVGGDAVGTLGDNFAVRLGATTIEVDVGTTYEGAKHVAVQADGMIVVAGTRVVSNSGETTMAVARIESNGSPDTTFGSNGVVLLNPGPSGSGYSDLTAGLSLQPDGAIVLGAKIGTVANSQDGDLAALRLLGTAAADTTPPEISYQLTGTQGVDGWWVSAVEIDWTVTDPDSTISSTAGCDAQALTTDTAGTTLGCSATSSGGTSHDSVTLKLDLVPPLAACLAEPPVYSVGDSGASYSVPFDGGTSGPSDGVASAPVDTTSAGNRSVSITVTDGAGNQTVLDCPYTVTAGALWSVTVIGPVQTTEPNRVAAGKVVPFRFLVLDGTQSPVDGISSVTLTRAGSAECGATWIAVTEYVKGKTGLVALGSGTYEYRLRWSRRSIGSCELVTLTLPDGSQIAATFEVVR